MKRSILLFLSLFMTLFIFSSCTFMEQKWYSEKQPESSILFRKDNTYISSEIGTGHYRFADNCYILNNGEIFKKEVQNNSDTLYNEVTNVRYYINQSDAEKAQILNMKKTDEDLHKVHDLIVGTWQNTANEEDQISFFMDGTYDFTCGKYQVYPLISKDDKAQEGNYYRRIQNFTIKGNYFLSESYRFRPIENVFEVSLKLDGNIEHLDPNYISFFNQDCSLLMNQKDQPYSLTLKDLKNDVTCKWVKII